MKIGVLMGGISSEREISMQSGRAILAALKRSGKDAEAVIIEKKEEIIKKVKKYEL